MNYYSYIVMKNAVFWDRRRVALYLLFTANVVTNSLTPSFLMIELIRFSETSVVTRDT
jgi:hypothetical protein